jgi:hypothetical protein
MWVVEMLLPLLPSRWCCLVLVTLLVQLVLLSQLVLRLLHFVVAVL